MLSLVVAVDDAVDDVAVVVVDVVIFDKLLGPLAGLVENGSIIFIILLLPK